MESSTAPYVVAQELRITSHDPVIIIDRMRCVFDEPILLATSYLPERLFPSLLDEDLTNTSLYQILQRKYGLTISKAKRYMEAVAANEMEARLLKIETGAPLMLIESTAYTHADCPFEYFRARHRGDRTRFLVESYTPVLP